MPRYGSQARALFWRRLDEYKTALRSGEGIVMASLAIHISLADVPKNYKRLVNNAYRTGGRD